MHPGPLLPNFLFPKAKHGPEPPPLPLPLGAGCLPLPRPPPFLMERDGMGGIKSDYYGVVMGFGLECKPRARLLPEELPFEMSF